ncbi:hypothetical protein J4458_04455 [Candidatus Woesearchaeota archaeon]|nr:hypothetical protein [Candidatus Woesearchaeota archaeon]
MKAMPILPKQRSGFNFSLILGLIFILVGIVFLLSLLNVNMPLNLKNAGKALQYGAAIGSILGGFSMLLKQRQPQIRV